MNDYVKVGSVGELQLGQSKIVEVEDVRIAIFNLDGELYAIEDVCTHDGAPLYNGDIVEGCQIECPRHGARFNIKTGAAVRMPAFVPIETYEVRIEGEDVFVKAPF